MKKHVIILLALFVCAQPLFAQLTPSQKMDEFIKQKADGFDNAYQKQDIKTYHTLLSEYLFLLENLAVEEKKQQSYLLSNIYYNLSCIYSLSNNRTSSITYLKKAIDSGWNDYRHIQFDTDLDNIRNEKEFVLLNNKLKTTGDYLYILKKAKVYNLQDNRPLPSFSYQSKEDGNLSALRNDLNLDSIAGQGTDVMKILNLMRWVHNLIPHDGMNGNPEVKNTLSMLEVCKNDNRGLNCRGLAIVLNECYLALGIKSRIVTCMPKDSLKMDQDVHVINSVYSESLEKWIWIDPTFNAYVMNEKGEMLSIEEVRQRLIEDKALILNPDANWNNKTPQTKINYLENYMAKNLYMLECPASSEYNMETVSEGKTYNYIRLLPLDYYEQEPQKEVDKREKSNTVWVTYKTNNSNIFWQQ